MKDNRELLRALAEAKVLFQQRAVLTHMGLPPARIVELTERCRSEGSIR